MNSKNINELINEAMAIEAQDAKEAGTLGFMCRSLVQATLPHRKTEGTIFTRKNGSFTLSIASLSEEYGLPYGSVPRLLLAWVSTEAVRTKEREVIFGHSLNDFMKQIGLLRTGGARGDITRLKNQTLKLFNCAISCTYTDPDQAAMRNILLADDIRLWWGTKDLNQTNLFQSSVTLSQRFFDEITKNPVPIDLRAISALKRSPMAIDIYTWLTYRNSYLRRSTVVPWESLQMQFGADYKLLKHFKEAFLEQLKRVHLVYPEAKIEEHQNGLMLKPSPTHIVMISTR